MYSTGSASMIMNVCDIAIVGSGIACSMTVCRLAERLKGLPARGTMLHIAIIEKDGEMWHGIPYGRRSIVGALTFQKLKEFLDEPERTHYIEWLASNEESWLNSFIERGGPGAAKWVSDNQPRMRRGEWEELYLPRFLFGQYVAHQAARAVNEAIKAGIATVTLIHGEATSISRPSGTLHTIMVEAETGAVSSVHAARVVLAVGSPPQRSICNEAVVAQHGHVHIGDLYSPSEDISIERIEHALRSVQDRKWANLLIVGSNASALEVLYIINHRPELRRLTHSVIVLSNSGLLPYRICDEPVQFELAALQRLDESGRFTAANLMAAITSDIRDAEELKLNIADLRDPVGATVNRLMTLMDSSEQENFVCEHGVHYSRLMRRAGRDTSSAAQELASVGVLTTVKGRFLTLEPSPAGHGLMSAAYAREGCHTEGVLPTPFSVTINCGGFEELDLCSSRLINSLINNGLCTVNKTNRGFLLSDRLEAGQGIYVIGPLVAGNFNAKVRFWHVESALRISSLAKLLAETLVDSLFTSIQYPLPETSGLVNAMVSRV